MVAFFTPPVLLKRPGAASAIWNPADKSGNTTLSNGNATATIANSNGGVRSSYISSGKRYFEFTITTLTGSASSNAIGIANASWSLTGGAFPGANDVYGLSYGLDGSLFAQFGGFYVSTAAPSQGDIIGLAVDFPNHLAYVARNNSWLASGNPAAGTNGIDWQDSNPVAPYFGTSGSNANSNAITLKTAGLTYAPPSGFTAGLA